MPEVAFVCASAEERRDNSLAASAGSDSATTAIRLGKTRSRTAASGKFPAQASAAWGSLRAHCRETFSSNVLRPSISLACKAKLAAAWGSASLHCEIILARVVWRDEPEGSF